MTSLDDYSYDLPPERIAQHPITPREDAKLMVLVSQNDKILHDHVGNLVSYLHEGDVVVLNNTKVFKARLKAIIIKPNNQTRQVEVFLVKPIQHKGLLPFDSAQGKLHFIPRNDTMHTSFTSLRSQHESLSTNSLWQAMGKPGKHIHVGTTIHITDDFFGTIIEKHTDGTFIIEFPYTKDRVIEQANRYGAVPTPPYIKEQASETDYQTVYAKNTGSVAAPTAGFHITDTILTQMRNKRVQIVEITLHVGLGTFLPIKSNTIEEHTMHSEWVHISQETTDAINTAKKEQRRIVAIGTTTLRALEGAYQITNSNRQITNSNRQITNSNRQITNSNRQITNSNYQHANDNSQKEKNSLFPLEPFTGDVNLFITPGFTFHIVDCLLTNFHLPQSTLLLLVSAFAGKERIRHAYEEAVRLKYRFFSFGDAMFLEQKKDR